MSALRTTVAASALLLALLVSTGCDRAMGTAPCEALLTPQWASELLGRPMVDADVHFYALKSGDMCTAALWDPEKRSGSGRILDVEVRAPDDADHARFAFEDAERQLGRDLSRIEVPPIGRKSVAFADAPPSPADAAALAACRQQQAAEAEAREAAMRAAADRLDAMGPDDIPADQAAQDQLAAELVAPVKAVGTTDCSGLEAGGRAYVFQTDEHVVNVRFWVPVGEGVTERYESFLRAWAGG